MSDIIRRRALLGGTRNTDAHECMVEYEFPRSHFTQRNPNTLSSKNITKVNWPEGITGIESYTFRGSSIDRDNFNEMPSTITQIGKYAFANCTNLLGNITLPENLEVLGDYALYYSDGINTVTLPTTDCLFGYQSIYYVKDINASEGVMYVFTYSTVTSSTSSTYWLGKQASGNVYLGDNYIQYKGTMPANTDLIIEPGTLSIAASAFSGKSQLKSITIPDTVRYIGSYAFSGCTGLTSITIPKSLDYEVYESLHTTNNYSESWPSVNSGSTSERIVNGPYGYVCPFYSTACTGITTVNWNAINGFGGSSSNTYYCFLGGGTYLPNLTTINFGSEVESIPDYLCYGLKKLTTITIPSSVKYIGYYAFNNCTGLTSITIPETVERLATGGNILNGCTGITTLNYNAISCIRTSSPTSTSEVNTLNNIWGTTSNLTTVNIGNQVQVIPSGFLGSGQSKITSITIPNSVTTINLYAFNGSKLTSIDLPASLTSIRNYAFNSCSSLTSITIRSTTPPTLDSSYTSTFPSTSQSYTIYVPASAVNTYKTTSKWSYWSSKIQAIPS